MYIIRTILTVLCAGFLHACGGTGSLGQLDTQSTTPPSPLIQPETQPVIPLPTPPVEQIVYSENVYLLGSSTIANMQAAISTWNSTYDLTTINHAKGGELMDSMCIRMGALPAFAKFEESKLVAKKRNYFLQDWPKDNNLKAFTATIAGVEGSVGIDTIGYYFTPTQNLELDNTVYHPIHAKTEFEKNSVFVLNLGKNNLLGDTLTHGQAPYVTENSHDCIAWIQENVTDRVVVMGHFSAKSTSQNILKNIELVNKDLAEKYGSHYFDFQAYVESADIWVDVGITPTTADLSAQQKGLLAPSLAADNIHLNTKASAAVIAKLYEFIKAKQWVE